MNFPRVLRRSAMGIGLAWLASPGGAAPTRYLDAAFEKVDVRKDVEFRTATNSKGESEKLKLDVYQPAGDTVRGRPAILWLHGGGFRPGNDKSQSYVVRMATEFAKRGYVSVASDYRVRAEQTAGRMAVLQDAVEDCRAALAWIKAQANELGVDATRIAVGGGSAGGFAAVSLVAVENTEAAKNGMPGVFALIDLWGSPAEGFMLGKVDKNFPPTVIAHGTADKSVPFAFSEALVVRLKENGVKHELMPIPGAGHTPSAHLPAIVETTAKFVFSVLKP